MILNLKKVITITFICSFYSLLAQSKITGIVTNLDGKALKNVEIFQELGGFITKTNGTGQFSFNTSQNQLKLIFYLEEYQIKELIINPQKNQNLKVQLIPILEQLTEVILTQRKRKIFALRQLKKIEGTAIYAGKKNEVVLLNEVVGNKAANSARQIYAQVVGLNIYENDDAGLQLNIGGRGLDPNRTSNFNTRQNGYDISADVLGYPESYYTPPADALKEIQIVRGAASLQYGTQFGGLLNFKFNEPPKNKKFELLTKQSLGSYGLFNSFNSIGGTVNKTSYYAYANYKKGNGFRPNSEFNSINIYAHLEHKISNRTSITLETTFLDYLAKQAGGLTDAMFYENPFQSNRSRNWFDINWNLWAVKFKHNFTDDTKFSLNFFGLNAARKALGWRGRYDGTVQNPVTDPDEFDTLTNTYDIRDLIVGKFRNWGAEARFLSAYNLVSQKHNYLVGVKYYHANNGERQGAGSKGVDADFNFYEDQNPTYSYKSRFRFPNRNLALFAENIFNVSDKFSITPGVRFEYIKTESLGSYRTILRNGAGEPIPDGILSYDDNRTKERNFALLGVGLSYKYNNAIELYGNISQNYRSVTYSDIRTVSPTFVVDENIDDEKGATADLGLRGKWNNFLTYDFSAFGLFYNQRIGLIIASEGVNKGDRLRTNIGDAFIYGFEGVADASWAHILNFNTEDYALNSFVNLALTSSEYKESLQVGVEGNKVEFIPDVNLKTGIKFGYKDFLSSVQFTHLSKQFTDASNSAPLKERENREGTIGYMPAYSILDISFSYTYKNWKLETGINNVLDEKYFTRRATGYPGPGIIPSSPRNWYTTLQFRF